MGNEYNVKKQPELTQHGIEFINKICSKSGNSLLSGNNNQLPFSDDGNGNLINKIWTANVKNDLGQTINNNIELAPLLIKWLNHYGRIYNLDPNILAAQIFKESDFMVWNYPPYNSNPKATNSTAMGISQFVMNSLYFVVIKNGYNISPAPTPHEIALLTNGLEHKTQDYAYVVKKSNTFFKIAWGNHPILLQNVMDNPQIMIQAQAMYMKYFADRCNGLASTSLFCYNRGTFMSPTYTEAITKAINWGGGEYIKEGVNYVNLIFKLLVKSFGFKLDFSFSEYDTTAEESKTV